MESSRASTVRLEMIVSLAKRRGFVYPGSEIYGGLANTWDYGPLGAELKRNIKNAWWEYFIQRREDMVGLDGGILLHPKVWEASGHVEEFNDPLVDCRRCKSRFRADTLIEERLHRPTEGLSLDDMTQIIQESSLACPVCGARDWTPVRKFNLMFRTFIGPVEEQSTPVYLRPETAQAIFVNFKQVVQTSRVKIPFGIGQIGKAFRNEITPGNFIFRLLEFEQMEIEYFIRPETWEAYFDDWLEEMARFLRWIGFKPDRLRTREHGPQELSHYSKKTIDFEYLFPFGWKELCGLAYRTDYDLRRHQEYSGEDLTYFDQERNERYIPHVIEPTMGVERLMLALLCDAYDEEPAVDVNGNPYTRVVLRFNPRIAPYKAAVLPLMRKPELVEVAKDVARELRQHFRIEYDETQSIGRRYRRQDEIGTPYCITIDYQTLDDRTVTVRDRDTMQQVRVPISDLVEEIENRLRSA
ncbi:glycine--tRNA ligase [Thermomicrobium sp. 4228-Ro]|uniref:glycine--tRNA ligase n=1 Tax=Thermomicrobium sp. 4228-Ro TaxID=2993937 RepID=UPI0022492BD2|nr:glycine--tRNA ligase [Thermomicrobium sp. 4228-Ro]MCX2727671.1 glycine--tRNA ligase [Thermomicrobium sp. 4228-Ro]